MLGRDHALSGALVWLAAAPEVARLLGERTSPAEIAVGAATCAGFALLPDIDEPNSTVSRKLGPISRGVSHVTRTLAGGHRQATHSLAFIALAGGGCWAAASSRTASAIIVAACVLLVARMVVPLGLGKIFGLSVALAAAAGWWAWQGNAQRDWLPVVAMIGVACHLVGDMLTREGVPPLWPIRWRIAVPLLGHTSSLRETLLGTTMSLGIAFFLWVEVLYPTLSLISLPRLA